MIQGLGTDSRGWILQRLAFVRRYRGHHLRQPRRRTQRQAARPLRPRADGARRHRGARRRRRRLGPRDGRVDGRRHRPDPRRAAPRAGPLAGARLHRVPAPAMAALAARAVGRRCAQTRACGPSPQHNLRWLVGPRSLRRFWPAFNALTPVSISAPAHAFVAQVRAILDMDDGLRDELPDRDGTDARDRRQPGHPHAASRQRGARRADPRRRARRRPGGAHGFMVENFGTFNRLVLDFLTRVTGQQQSILASGSPDIRTI